MPPGAFRIVPGASHLSRTSPNTMRGLRGVRGLGALSVLYPDSPYPSPFAQSREMLAPSGAARDQLEGPGEAAPLVLAPELDITQARLPPFTQPAATPVREELRYGKVTNVPLSIGIAAARVLVAPPPNTRRAFLFIVNTHATQLLFLNFGDVASALNGIQINPGNGAIGFDAFVPQDDIWLLGNGALTTGVLSYANRGVNDYPSLA